MREFDRSVRVSKIPRKVGDCEQLKATSSVSLYDSAYYLWNLPSSDYLHHEFLRNRFKILAHDDIIVVRFSDNETKAEILQPKTQQLHSLEVKTARKGSFYE